MLKDKLVKQKLIRYWERIWMKLSGRSISGRFATKMAGLFSPPYKGRNYLARYSNKGYISPSAKINCSNVSFGKNIFIGDQVVIHDRKSNGNVYIDDRVCIHQDTIIEIGDGGCITISSDTHIQPRCHLSAYKGSINIGSNVQIAPTCGFYPYDHNFDNLNENIRNQSLRTRGGIILEDEVWLGFNVTVLDGVRIGKGSVIGAGSVVNKNIPPYSIAAGVPAHVIKKRG